MGAVLAAAAIAVAAVMVLTWVASVVLRDVSIVDLVWGRRLRSSAWWRPWSLPGMPAAGSCWRSSSACGGLRLGGHLTRRKLADRSEDQRYASMRERRGAALPAGSLVMIFGLHGLLVLVVSLPLTAAARCSAELDALIVPGLLVWAIGLTFETIGFIPRPPRG
jgi:steroid 5-alpha reductase family enzyme